MQKLTPRQQEILDLIRNAIQNTGFPPTRAEIANELGFRSANAAEEHLQALARKGAIEISPGTSRGIRLCGDLGAERGADRFMSSQMSLPHPALLRALSERSIPVMAFEPIQKNLEGAFWTLARGAADSRAA